MAEALSLLIQGRLAPQILMLRVMHLPSDTTQQGEIIRIEAGQLSRRNYQPGVELGDWVTTTLDPQTFQAVVQQLLDAEVWSLPAVLPFADTYQMNVSALDHSLLIRSRPLNNQKVQQRKTTGISFTSLAESLLSLQPGAEPTR